MTGRRGVAAMSGITAAVVLAAVSGLAQTASAAGDSGARRGLVKSSGGDHGGRGGGGDHRGSYSRGGGHGSSHSSHGGSRYDHGHKYNHGHGHDHHDSNVKINLSFGTGYGYGYGGYGYGYSSRYSHWSYGHGPVVVRRTYVDPCPPVVVHRPVIIERPVYSEPVVVERPVYVEKPVVVEREVVVERPVVVEKPVYVEKPVVVERRVEAPQRADDQSAIYRDRELGDAYMRMGDFHNAVRAYGRYVTSGGGKQDGVAVRNYGLALVATGKPTEGFSNFATGYRIEPGMHERPLRAADFGGEKGFGTVMESAVRAADQTNSAEGWMTVAVLRRANGENEFAEQALKRARDAGLEQGLLDEMVLTQND